MKRREEKKTGGACHQGLATGTWRYCWCKTSWREKRARTTEKVNFRSWGGLGFGLMSWTRVQAQRRCHRREVKKIYRFSDLEDTADLSNNHGEKLWKFLVLRQILVASYFSMQNRSRKWLKTMQPRHFKIKERERWWRQWNLPTWWTVCGTLSVRHPSAT